MLQEGEQLDLDDIKREIQDFFQDGTVTIVGSGLSLAEGIPGMFELANELQTKITPLLTDVNDIALWKAICIDLKSGIGLEQALHNNKPSSFIEDKIRNITAHFIGNYESVVLKELIQGGRTLRFSEYLKRFNISEANHTIITTNYDRLIEYSCEFMHVCVDTLCVGKYLAHFLPDKSKYLYCSGTKKVGNKQKLTFKPKVTVLKPHGCLSWHMVLGEPYAIPNYTFDDCLIITPGLDKYRRGYNVPFDTHRNLANAAIDKAKRYIIIGYGFNDDHLETHLVQQLKNNKAALILTYALSDKAIRLIKECKNIIAICSESKTSSKVVTSHEEVTLTGINIWDLHEMIKEVF